MTPNVPVCKTGLSYGRVEISPRNKIMYQCTNKDTRLYIGMVLK